jgi:hypothetical protein
MSVLNNLASNIQTKINDIAETLYDATTITDKVVFLVTDSEQKFNDYVTNMEFKVGETIPYTPVLLKRVLATKQDDYVYGKYIETYRLDILAYEKDKLSVEKIFDTYTEQENFNDYEITDGVQIKKNHGKILFQQTINAQSGTDEHFFYYTYDLTIATVIGSVVKESSSVKIDGVTMDFISVNFQNDKVQIPNIAYGTNTNLPSTNGRVIGLTLPIVKTGQQAEKNKELFDDVTLNRYNKTHTIQWTIDDYQTVTIEAVVRSGTISYNNDELINFVVIFEQALPRTTLQIDGVSIPAISVNYQRDYNVESITKEEEVESVAVSSGINIFVRIAHDHTIEKSREILNEILNHNIGTEYEVTTNIGTTNTITTTNTCIIKNGTYAYEQTGELIYEVTFVKVV